MITSTPLLEVADSIVYVSSLLADRPRPIDRVIDYFGGANQVSGTMSRPDQLLDLTGCRAG